MREKTCFRISAVLLSLAALLSTSCGSSEPSRFYLLSPMARAGEAPAEAKNDLSLLIGPVSLPDYIDRPQMVVHTGANEVRLQEFDRWAEPLAKNLTRVLMENLSMLLSTERIAQFPWKGLSTPDYRLLVHVADLELRPGQEVVLKLRWALIESKTEEVVKQKLSTFRKPVKEEDGYQGLAAACSEAVAELSLEIAEALTKG